MTDQRADLADNIRICYRTRGETRGEPLVLIAGLGQDLTVWPATLLDGLVEQGHYVIHYDNRDVGRSSRGVASAPGPVRQLLGRPRRDAYGLSDMAADTVGLLNHMGIERAHLVGLSMGGMIAQTVAAEHPDRVDTLVSLCSTTGAAGVGQASLPTKLRIVASPSPRTRDQAVRRHLSVTGLLAGPAYPPDPQIEAAYARTAWDRAGGVDPGGAARQIQAIQAAGDRTRQLHRITAPTLIVHGDHDPIVHPSGGFATAAAVPGARHHTVAGMGHHVAPGLVPVLVELITRHTTPSIRD